jgi:hypothetical protein
VEKIAVATVTGMSAGEFAVEVKKWAATAKDSRLMRPCTELTYQPMQELRQYLRAFPTSHRTGRRNATSAGLCRLGRASAKPSKSARSR